MDRQATLEQYAPIMSKAILLSVQSQDFVGGGGLIL